MILSDRTMDKMIKEGTLVVRPITEGQIQPASIDIRLGNTFSIVDDTPNQKSLLIIAIIFSSAYKFKNTN